MLVVGEQPTGGINDDQWANAVHWLAQSASTQQNGSPRTLNILGPSFSGSFPSLDRELHDIYRSPDDPALLPFKAKFPSVAILSGNVSGCGPVRWFQDRWPDQNSDIPTSSAHSSKTTPSPFFVFSATSRPREWMRAIRPS